MKDFKIIVQYQGKEFDFDFGSQAYIFHTGIHMDMDVKYGIEVLLEYVGLVNSCYLSDSNRTPLGALADFVAERWDEVKSMDRYELLDKFYTEYDY